MAVAADRRRASSPLLMSWFVADQYTFFWKEIVRSKRYGFDALRLTVVSDKLSGDDDTRRRNELNLRNLIDPEADADPLVLTRSTQSDVFSGDLLVDNLAGWLTAAIADHTGEFAQGAAQLAPTGVWTGWYELLSDSPQLKSTPAVARLAPSA